MSKYPINMDELWDGRVFKNYKDLCHQMNWKSYKLSSNGALAQLKVLSTVCKWRKDVDENGKKLSNKIIIEEVYNKPLPFPDKRKTICHKIEFSGYHIPQEYSKSKGVYRIICDNEVYIGSTRRGFRRRFIEHLKLNNQPTTKDLLERGGRFEVVEVMNNSSKEEILMREDYYIDLYSKDKDYTVVNQRPALPSPPKVKYKRLLVLEDDYELAMSLLEEHGIRLKPTQDMESE